MRLVSVVVIASQVLLACSGNDSGSDGVGDASTSLDSGAGTAGTSRGTTGGSTADDGGPADAASAGTSGGRSSGSGGTRSAGTGGAQGRACLIAGSFCTWSNAEDCCSGRCDGDSCCGFLGDACLNGFGCCEGDCIAGTCQCPPGTLDCGNGCTDVEWNENACGDCDTRCGVSSLCENGQCICDPNLFDAQFYVQCSDGCFNTRVDEQHCGDCTTTCIGGTECAGSTCECPSGTLDCGSGCKDITANALRCGSCTNACDSATEDCVDRQCQCRPGLYACTPGVCVDRETDESNCGTCGLTCTGNRTCQGGDCVN